MLIALFCACLVQDRSVLDAAMQLSHASPAVFVG